MGKNKLRNIGRKVINKEEREGNNNIINYLLDRLKEGKNLENINDILIEIDGMGKNEWKMYVENGKLEN